MESNLILSNTMSLKWKRKREHNKTIDGTKRKKGQKISHGMKSTYKKKNNRERKRTRLNNSIPSSFPLWTWKSRVRYTWYGRWHKLPAFHPSQSENLRWIFQNVCISPYLRPLDPGFIKEPSNCRSFSSLHKIKGRESLWQSVFKRYPLMNFRRGSMTRAFPSHKKNISSDKNISSSEAVKIAMSAR